MKESKFNFCYKRESDYVIYNTFTKALVIVNDAELVQIKNLHKSETKENEFLSVLYKEGILIDEDFDEINFLKYFNYKSKFSATELSLTIAPTLNCNFACPYCYENARKGKMNKEVQESLVAYIKSKIQEGVKKIDITWYGGEPLLYPEIVDNLASKIKKLCEENQVSLGYSLVTNGYLLTSKIVEMLIRNEILSIQITLDGLAKNHNQRRFLRNGDESFDTILENIKLFDQTPVKVNIRMNVDKNNQSDYPKLRSLIEGFNNKNIGIYPSAVENLNEREIERNEYYMSSNEYDDFILGAYNDKNIAESGLDIINDRRYFCSAELENSYVIDELGNFYKCWDEIGNLKNICFNVMNPDLINYKPVLRYLVDDPFSDKKCLNCKFLPLCFGGCKYQKNNLNKSICNFTDQTLRAFLETKYFISKEM